MALMRSVNYIPIFVDSGHKIKDLYCGKNVFAFQYKKCS